MYFTDVVNWVVIRAGRGVGGGGEISPALFPKLEKSALIWRENALTVVISE